MAKYNPCCRLSLKTGSMLVAFVEITLSVLFAGFYVYIIGILAKMQSNNDYIAIKAVKTQAKKDNPGMSDAEADGVFTALYTLLGLCCIMCILQIFFAFLLILGIRRERLRLLKLWLVFKASCLAFQVIFTIAVAVIQHKRKSHGEVAMDVFTVLLGQYFLYVVYRLYREMWDNLKNQQRPKPNVQSKHDYYG